MTKNMSFKVSSRLLVVFLLLFQGIGLYGQKNTLKTNADAMKVANAERVNERIGNEELTFRMTLNNDSLGFTKVKYAIENGKLIAQEYVSAMVNNSPLVEEIQSVYDIRKGQMNHSEVMINYQGNRFSFSADWVDNKLMKAKINEKDTTVIHTSHHFDRMFTLFVLPRLIYDNGHNLAYDQFSPTDLQFRQVVASPKGKTYLNTEFGRVDCNILKFEGGMASQTMYMDQETHRIMKIEIPAMGWEYELISIVTDR